MKQQAEVRDGRLLCEIINVPDHSVLTILSRPKATNKEKNTWFFTQALINAAWKNIFQQKGCQLMDINGKNQNFICLHTADIQHPCILLKNGLS